MKYTKTRLPIISSTFRKEPLKIYNIVMNVMHYYTNMIQQGRPLFEI